MGTVSLTFSIDLELLNYIEDYAKFHKVSRSLAISYHMRMGRIYLKMLDEAENERVKGRGKDVQKDTV